MVEGEDSPGIYWDLAIAIGHTILKCDDDAKSVLKERAKEMRRKEKKARKKSRRKASKKDGGSHKS